MSNSKSGSECMSRRAVVRSAALAFGVAAAGVAVTPAGAQTKISQADAKYQDSPKGQQTCATCANFQAPNACKFVQGTISQNGWCQLFAPK